MENAQEALNALPYLIGRLNDWRQWEKVGHNHDLLKEAITAIEALRERVETARLEVEQCHAKSTCMCGDYVKQHSGYNGHTPVAMYDYALDGANTLNKELVWAAKVALKTIEYYEDTPAGRSDMVGAGMLRAVLAKYGEPS